MNILDSFIRVADSMGTVGLSVDSFVDKRGYFEHISNLDCTFDNYTLVDYIID